MPPLLLVMGVEVSVFPSRGSSPSWVGFNEEAPFYLVVANATKSENIPREAVVAEVHWDLISFEVEDVVGFCTESFLDHFHHGTDVRIGHVGCARGGVAGVTISERRENSLKANSHLNLASREITSLRGKFPISFDVMLEPGISLGGGQ